MCTLQFPGNGRALKFFFSQVSSKKCWMWFPFVGLRTECTPSFIHLKCREMPFPAFQVVSRKIIFRCRPPWADPRKMFGSPTTLDGSNSGTGVSGANPVAVQSAASMANGQTIENFDGNNSNVVSPGQSLCLHLGPLVDRGMAWQLLVVGHQAGIN